MPRTIALLLALLAWPAMAIDLRLPFGGRWFVLQGGDTPNVNHHMAVRSQWYGLDFGKLGGPDERALSTPQPTSVEAFFSWGVPVQAPADGEVVVAVRDLPDNPLGVRDEARPAGNHVILRVAEHRYVVLAHFQKDSLSVRPGDKVVRGQPLGRCGNSGNSDFPHLQLHVQDKPSLFTGTGQNPRFIAMDVQMNGMTFRNVDWPLLRGLFVNPR